MKFSATNGIVSAIRTQPEGTDLFVPADQQTFLQTTAMITGGSSGGPLLSADGQVLGINSFVEQGRHVAFAIHVRHLLNLRDKAAAVAMPLPGDPASELYNPLTQLDPRIREMYAEYQNAMAQHERPLGFLERRPDHPGPKYAQRFVQIAERERKSALAFQALWLACLVDP